MFSAYIPADLQQGFNKAALLGKSRGIYVETFFADWCHIHSATQNTGKTVQNLGLLRATTFGVLNMIFPTTCQYT